jgi:hypothetical protein
MRTCFLFITVTLVHLSLFSQNEARKVVQFTGVVMTSDSLAAMPGVIIFDATTKRGTMSNYKGFFSFAANTGDTIRFSCIGFEQKTFIIPATLEEDRYSIIQLMTADTIYLAETIIYPWPTRDEFREAFVTLDIPDDDYELARKNLENDMLKEMGLDLAYDSDMLADYQTKQLAQKIYYAGQNPPVTIFNIFNWIKFFEAWERGDFKKKTDD